MFRVTSAAREFLLQEGTDQRYGARHLKRAIERNIVYPLANLLATEQIHMGDLICIDFDQKESSLTFTREGENLSMPVRRPEPVTLLKAAQAKSGKTVEAPVGGQVPEPTPRMAR